MARPVKRPATIRELGQIALAAVQGNTDAAVWLLQRMKLDRALRRMRALDTERKGATVH